MGFENKELCAWLERTVKTIMDEKADGIAFAAQLQNGEILTAYFKAGPCRKMELASHIQVDAMRDVFAAKGEEEKNAD